MDNIDSIIARVKKRSGVHKNFEVADIFNLNGPEFSRRKTRGTLLPLVIEWGLSNDVDLNWLLTGEAHLAEDLLENAVTQTERRLVKHRKKLTPEMKARIVVLQYQNLMDSGEAIPDKEMERYLRLVS